MIDIKQLSFTYRPKKPAEKLFDRLDLRLEPGNIYGLLGKNGAGKTTLLKIIAGLLFPQEGAVQVMHVAAQKRLPSMLSELFILPEEFSLPPLCIHSYIALHEGLYPRFDRKNFTEYAAELEIDPDARLTSLSYGQKKKFLIAFGLATEARVVLLDEPTNGLDIPSKSRFRRILAATLHDNRIFLISTHQVRDMVNLIDPIIILDSGRIIFQQALRTVAERLTGGVQKKEPRNGAIYWEKVLGGYAVLKRRQEGEEEMHIDIELLFNAILSNQESFQKIFPNEVII